MKDSMYRDTIMFNDQTKAFCTVSTDTISIELDIRNDQYLYIYKTKEYKNKKSFFKRLLTLDFKKEEKTLY